MRLSVDKLGKVAITIEEGYWSNTKDYDKLTVVEAPGNEYKTYISRKPVPAGTVLTNRVYWIPFSSLREEIVLDFNTFVALWTENLATTNARIDASNARIEEVNDSLLLKERNLYLAISSIITGGVALKQELGDSEVYGISQKVLTKHLEELHDVSQVDLPNIRYVVEKNNRRFFIPMTELIKPAYPTVSVTTYNIVTGNAQVTVTIPEGDDMIGYYSINNEETWTELSNGKAIIPSGFSLDKDNVSLTVALKLKTIQYGEESDVNTVNITINPKVANGSISVTRTPNNNDYATAAAITITPSASANATSEYSTDGGSTWNTFSEATTINISTTATSGTYKVRATKTGYIDAAVVSSTAITLNKKKFYYGMGDATLANEAAIQALTGGSSLEQSTMVGEYDIVVATTGKYIWFCGSGTLTAVTSEGFTVPMEYITVIDGYNCYRSSSAVQETGTNTFNIE